MENFNSEIATSGAPSSARDCIDGKAKYISPELVRSVALGALTVAMLAGLVTAEDEVTWCPGCPCR